MPLSHLPDPEFISRDVNTITAELTAKYELLAGKTLYPAQADRVFVDVIAYREMLLRTAINEAAKQNLVAFATGVMLDYLGDFFGVVRLDGETDEQLRTRIRLAPENYSTTGSRRAYIYHALTADERVIDAEAINVDNRVQVYILTADAFESDVPDELINKVQLAVSDDKRRPLSDHVTTYKAVAHTYELDIDLLVYAEADALVVKQTVLEQLQTLTQGLCSKLGQSVIPSQLIQTIRHEAIQQIIINQPTGLVNIKPYEYAVCTAITLNLREVRRDF